MTQKTLLQQYQALHDGLSNMIEDGRLTYEMIPDDYDWLLLTLLEAMDIEANEKRKLAVDYKPLTLALADIKRRVGNQ